MQPDKLICDVSAAEETATDTLQNQLSFLVMYARAIALN